VARLYLACHLCRLCCAALHLLRLVHHQPEEAQPAERSGHHSIPAATAAQTAQRLKLERGMELPLLLLLLLPAPQLYKKRS
jgi:hypothetical protein